jgi:hypothetical protein
MSRRSAYFAALLLPLLLLACGGGDNDSSDDTPGTPVTMPLELGSSWEYDVSNQWNDDAPTTWTQVDSLTGRTAIDGFDYSVVETLVALQEADTTFVRQSGQSVFIIPGELPAASSTSAPINWAARTLKASLPWKVAEFTSPKGQIASFTADTSFAQLNMTVRLQINSANLGRTSVDVPAGSFDDVYKGRLTRLVAISQGGITVATLTNTLDIYIKDAVGVVRQVSVEEYQETGAPGYTATTTLSLRSHRAGP